MVNLAGALLCPHSDSRVPEDGQSSRGIPGPRTTVYVNGGKGTMGLCLRCKSAMERLIRRDAPLAEVVATLVALGYSRQDGAEFHAQLRRGPARWWRRLANRALVNLAPTTGEVPA